MSTKQLLRLATALVVILVAWGAVTLARGSSADRSSSFALPRIDSASVDTIALTARRDTEVLARDAHGQWRVSGYPASPTMVSALLHALDDTIAWSELVAEQPSSHAALGVDADSGRRVRVVSHGKTLLDITTGKRTQDFGGLYLRRTDANPVYAWHGMLVGALDHRTVNDWRDKRIADVEPESVAAIAVQRGAHRYTLRRASGKGAKNGTSGAWTFASGHAADSAAVHRLLGEYTDLTASSFATSAQADSVSFAKPALHARLLSATGAPLASLAFDSTKSGVWVRADSGATVYRIDPWRLSSLLPAESTLQPKEGKTAAKKK
ncbi:MAG TPA: DUF4340 domain-containing protein [Gemmatimonadaceae bacterium]|nr:DUF4340 domain-containing protein [Gemmatimonadaceae bacterium]